jgi:hypothetical protein
MYSDMTYECTKTHTTQIDIIDYVAYKMAKGLILLNFTY